MDQSTLQNVPVVADHQMLERIGTGAYGEVWLARSVTGALRAVKIIRREQFDHERTFEREFSGLKKFEPLSRLHEGLVDILQIGRDAAPGRVYYVMELADNADESGQSYRPLTLAEAVRQKGRLPVKECARIGASVADSLGFLHARGLVHRDIKPANIIFVGGRPKLADIGLVASLGDARSFVGTDGFIAPEGPGSPRADIFSLGKTLYEMATGKNRLEFPDLPANLIDSPEACEFSELNETILRACSQQPDERHASAEDFRGELLLVDAGRSVRRLRRNERLVAIWRRAAFAALVLILIAGAGLWAERRRAEAARQIAIQESVHRRQIEQRELAALNNLYAADMNLAQQAIAAGSFGRAESLLGAYIPRGGQDDPRGFEWFHLWHRVRGDSAAILQGHEHVVSSLALSPDGNRLYSASFDTTVREWSLQEGRELRRWTMPGSLFAAIALDPTGSLLAGEGGNRPFSSLRDLQTGAWVTNITSASSSVSFSPDGKRVVRGAKAMLFDTDGEIEITDPRLRPERIVHESGGRVAFSPDGK
ncbi:MAG TPA: serine/threonine-protein kinase, partial [Verrucomicrobiae bacterium]|nr:serine/threonine-protein kinase [Verrucomicrobiae bacterium]